MPLLFVVGGAERRGAGPNEGSESAGGTLPRLVELRGGVFGEDFGLVLDNERRPAPLGLDDFARDSGVEGGVTSALFFCSVEDLLAASTIRLRLEMAPCADGSDGNGAAMEVAKSETPLMVWTMFPPVRKALLASLPSVFAARASSHIRWWHALCKSVGGGFDSHVPP